MKFENEFDVAAPAEAVWRTLLDIERVTPCMPGAQVIEAGAGDAYKVAIKVKVGPISMTYRGDVAIVERDDLARQATLRVKAKEARGQGSADAHVRMTLSDAGGGSRGRLETDVQLTGKAASMGRGVIGDVAERLVQTFATNLAEMLGDQDDAAPAEGRSADSAPADGGSAESAQTEPPNAPPATQPPPPPAPALPPPLRSAPGPAADALPAGEIAASVIAGRLAQPRALLLAIAAVAALGALVGYRFGRGRR